MAKKSKALVPQVLDALEAEVGSVLEETTMVQRFALAARAFFVTAATLESKAKENLTLAKALTLPTTKDEDEKIQKAIKAFGADKKEAIAHWEITLKVSRFHKRLVAARSRAEAPNEEAVKLATTLHNTYVEKETRRVAAENERLRREAEQRAADDRAREVAEMERKALEAELAGAGLSDRERRFVENYYIIVAGGGSDDEGAARLAGYKNPRETAMRLLALVKIKDAIEAKRTAAALREQAAAVKEQPLDVQVQEVKTEVSTAYGRDRATHSAELLDERMLIEAILGGKHGIPSDILQVNTTKLNEYARSLHELISRWPGVRYKKTTGLV